MVSTLSIHPIIKVVQHDHTKKCTYCGDYGGEMVRDAARGHRWAPCPQCATRGSVVVTYIAPIYGWLVGGAA